MVKLKYNFKDLDDYEGRCALEPILEKYGGIKVLDGAPSDGERYCLYGFYEGAAFFEVDPLMSIDLYLLGFPQDSATYHALKSELDTLKEQVERKQ